MPQWSNAPLFNSRGHALQLIRTPATGKLYLHVTSDDMIGCNTHWFGGRTIPCESPNCPACLEGVPWRWHSYLSALIHGTRHHVLVEFTAQAAEIITSYRKDQGTLKGCLLTACRHRNKRNGRVLINCKPGSLAEMNLPPAPDLIACLSIIWNIPTSELGEAPTERQQPRVARTAPKAARRSNNKRAKEDPTLFPQN